MGDHYFFPEQFKCMYCRVDLDETGELGLPAGDAIDLKCPQCEAVWRFWTKVQLFHRMVQGGKYNRRPDKNTQAHKIIAG
ncbi:hypothetical protein HYW17_00135 [Candidatus Uhrbacteria bacterium]|nr:hypothetical protein [Candidatus Uhrbacteria bacterium]